MARKKLAIACQGGGSHTAFTAGVLSQFLSAGVQEEYDLVGLSGTSGGGICAAAAWYGLVKVAKGATEPPDKWLVDFWKDNTASSWWEKCLNDWTIQSVRWQEAGLLPSFATNPYAAEWLLHWWQSLAPRKEFFDFQSLLEKHISFPEIETLVEPSSPRLLLGAVNILSGEFKTFDSRRKGEIRVEALMASAAIPSIFKAVEIDGDAYWDGLFADNPPLKEFLDADVDRRPDEIWVVQINPQSIKTVPQTAQAIVDRRNELAGNLSLYQEIESIELINQLLAEGFFKEEKMSQIKPIKICWICMSDEVSHRLDYASKLERNSSFIDLLLADGRQQAEKFLMSLNGGH